MAETPSINPPPPPLPAAQTPSVSEEEDDDHHHQSEPKPKPKPKPKPLLDRNEICKALEIIERDSISIAESYTSLFSSLRLALSEVTSSSVDHMHCLSDVIGRLQESAIDAATRGNRYIHSCLRLSEEMKSIESLAIQLKILRKNVDTLDSAVNRLVRLP